MVRTGFLLAVLRYLFAPRSSAWRCGGRIFTVLSTMCVIFWFGKVDFLSPKVTFFLISIGKTLLELNSYSWTLDTYPGPIAFDIGLAIE